MTFTSSPLRISSRPASNILPGPVLDAENACLRLAYRLKRRQERARVVRPVGGNAVSVGTKGVMNYYYLTIALLKLLDRKLPTNAKGHQEAERPTSPRCNVKHVSSKSTQQQHI